MAQHARPHTQLMFDCIPTLVLASVLYDYLHDVRDIVNLDTAVVVDNRVRPVYLDALRRALGRRYALTHLEAEGIAWANARGLSISNLRFDLFRVDQGYAALRLAATRGMRADTLNGLTHLEVSGNCTINEYGFSSLAIDNADMKILTVGGRLQVLGPRLPQLTYPGSL